MAQQIGQRTVNGRGGEQVIVIEDQHTPPAACEDSINDRRQDALELKLGCGTQVLGQLYQFSDRSQGLDQAGNQVSTEGKWIIIAGV